VLRPHLKIPLKAAAGIPAAAYVVRSIVRGWDFSPDLPVDAILGIALAALIALAWWLRRSTGTDSASSELARQVHDEHDAKGDGR